MSLPSGARSVPLPGASARFSRTAVAPVHGHSHRVSQRTGPNQAFPDNYAIAEFSPRCRQGPSRQISAPRSLGMARIPRELSPQPGSESRVPSFPSSAVCAPGPPRELSPRPRLANWISDAHSIASSGVCASGITAVSRQCSLPQRIDGRVPVAPSLSGASVIHERIRTDHSCSSSSVPAGMVATASAEGREKFSMPQPLVQHSNCQVKKFLAGPQRSSSRERRQGMASQTTAMISSVMQCASSSQNASRLSALHSRSATTASASGQESRSTPRMVSSSFPLQTATSHLISNSDHAVQSIEPRNLQQLCVPFGNPASMSLPVGPPNAPSIVSSRAVIAGQPSQSMMVPMPSQPRELISLGNASTSSTLAAPSSTGPDLSSNPQYHPLGVTMQIPQEVVPLYHERPNAAQVRDNNGGTPEATTLREELTQAQEMMCTLREELLQPFRALDDLVRAQELMQTKLDVLDEEVHQVLQMSPAEHDVSKEVNIGVTSSSPSPVPQVESGVGSTCDTTPESYQAVRAEISMSRRVDARDYNIILDKSSGARLGINLTGDESDQVLWVNDVRQGGLVDMWNSNHPDMKVIVGDQIIEVNGVEGSCEMMLKECQADQLLHITLKRPSVNIALGHERVRLHSSQTCSNVTIEPEPQLEHMEKNHSAFENTRDASVRQSANRAVTPEPVDMDEVGTSKKLRFDNEVVSGDSGGDSDKSELCDSDAKLDDTSKKTLSIVAGATILQIANSTLHKSSATRQFSMFSAALAGRVDPALSIQACEDVDRNKLSEDKECLEVVRHLFFNSLPDEFVKIDTIEQVFKPSSLRHFVKGVGQQGGSVEAAFHGVPSGDVEHIRSDGILRHPLSAAVSAQGVHVARHAGVAHQNAEQDGSGRRHMCLVLTDADTLSKNLDIDSEHEELPDGPQIGQRYCFVEERRLLVSHLITYRVTGVVRKRSVSGWRDPFEKKIAEALERSS